MLANSDHRWFNHQSSLFLGESGCAAFCRERCKARPAQEHEECHMLASVVHESRTRSRYESEKVSFEGSYAAVKMN